nr:hypothetical protein [Tanacetum cinerariifolium]
VVHEILQLNDAEGVICLPNDEIFAGLARMGYEKPSTKLTFYKAFFSTQWKVGKGFSGVETPLFETMLAVRDVAEEEEAQVSTQGDEVQEPPAEEVANDVVPPTPTSPSPSSPVIQSSPPHQSPCPPQPQDAEDDVENVFNQGRNIVDMDQDEGIEQVVDQEKDAEYIKRYHEIKKKPQSESEAYKNMISYLKNTEGYKMEFFKGKTQEKKWKKDEEIIKSINETPAQKAAKRRRQQREES